MKIADFFVSLGFDIDGAPELKELDARLGTMMGNASKLLAVFASMTAAMGVMLNKTLDTAEGFRKFEAVTGLSGNELKRWNYLAKQTGTEADEVASSIKSLQEARANIMMGTGNVKPWQLLGIAPSDNPFETLKLIRERIKDLDPAIARTIVSQMGIGEGVFAMLRLSNKEFEDLNRKFELTRGQTDALNKANVEWAKFKFEISAVRDRIVAELIPALTPVIKFLGKIVGLMGNFANWLSKGSAAAKVVRVAMIAVAAAIVAITAALTVLVGVLGLATAAIAALQLAAAPIMPVLWAIAAAVLVATAVLAAAVLIVQDLWVALTGGDSVIEKALIKPFKEFGLKINGVIEDMLRFLGIFDSLKNAATWLYSKATGATMLDADDLKKLDEASKKYRDFRAGQMLDPSASLTDAALAPKASTGNSSNVSQENNISINVDGGKDPFQTGRAIADPLKRALTDAAYQIPVPAL